MQSTIRFRDEKVRRAYYKLADGDDADRRMFSQIGKVLDVLERDAHAGVQIPKRLIPRSYNVPNLWKYDLPDGWRLLYSVFADDVVVVSLVLDWGSHPWYERLMGY